MPTFIFICTVPDMHITKLFSGSDTHTHTHRHRDTQRKAKKEGQRERIAVEGVERD